MSDEKESDKIESRPRLLLKWLMGATGAVVIALAVAWATHLFGPETLAPAAAQKEPESWKQLGSGGRMICVSLSHAIRIRDQAGRHGAMTVDFERPMRELRDNIDSIPDLLLENPFGPFDTYSNASNVKLTFDDNFFPNQQFRFPDTPENRQHVMVQLIELLERLDPDKKCL